MRRRVRSILALMLPLLASIGWLVSVDWDTKVSTNVMDLIPEQGTNPELEVARNILTTVYSDQVNVLLREVSDEAAVRTFIDRVADSPLTLHVMESTDPEAMDRVGEWVYENRFLLLFPDWLQRAQRATGAGTPDALADYAVAQLDAALDRPDAFAFEDLIPADPLLLVPRAAAVLDRLDGAGALPDGYHLLTVKLAVSAMSREGQQPVFDLFAQALAEARVHSPEMTALDSGAHRYAAATEQKMRDEVSWLNLSTFAAVLVICVVLCRRALLVVHVFAMLTLSLVVSVALMTLLFQEVNVFALVFGCVLCGVIVDYGLHAYLHGAATGDRKLRTFLRPFLISSGSTLAGFTILMFSQLPVLRQMGAFVSLGLAVAMVVTLVYAFGILRADPVTPSPLFQAKRRWRFPWLLPVVAVLGLILIPRISWEDDIRSLQYPLPQLDADDAYIRGLQGDERRIFITVGSDFAEARVHLDQFHSWLDQNEVPADAVLSAGDWVPTKADFLSARNFAATYSEFGDQVLRALEVAGYEADAFEVFQQDWRAYASTAGTAEADYSDMIARFTEALSGQLQGLAGGDDGVYWWMSLLDAHHNPGRPPADTHSLQLDQVESLSDVLAQYRARTLQLSLWASAMIFVILLAVFRWPVGGLIMSVPAASVCAAAAVMYLTTGSLGMFHLVGMFLGVCLVLDYSVFTWIGCRDAGRMPFSVIVSAVTTSASFFILSLSNIPSIHALGMAVFTVTLIGALLNYTFIPGMVDRTISNG